MKAVRILLFAATVTSTAFAQFLTLEITDPATDRLLRRDALMLREMKPGPDGKKGENVYFRHGLFLTAHQTAAGSLTVDIEVRNSMPAPNETRTPVDESAPQFHGKVKDGDVRVVPGIGKITFHLTDKLLSAASEQPAPAGQKPAAPAPATVTDTP